MFLGHIAVAFASKRWAPRVPLGILVLAGIWLDVLWPVFLLAGWEGVTLRPGAGLFETLEFSDYPWSHSLLMVLVWSGAAGAAWFAWRRATREALVVGGLVASHWFLDLVVHRPDLPLWPGGPEVGLGVWTVPAAAMALEVTLLLVGAWLYAGATRARGRAAAWTLRVVVALFLLVYAASGLGDAPPSVSVLAYSGFAQLLFPLLAWVIDRQRDASDAGGTPHGIAQP